MAKIHLPHISLEVVEDKAKELLLGAAKGLTPSENVLELAVDKLVTWLDDQISYGPGLVAKFIDAHDQDLLKFLLHLVVHSVYKELVQSGQLAG